MQPKDASIRKRTQIAQTSRMMFIWVAIVSVIVGFALVGAIFLAKKLIFNEKVLADKATTVKILRADNAIVPELEDQVRVLDTNPALISSKANANDQAVQVILDALPSDANSLALGASLQTKLLANIPGLTINTLDVNPVVGVETSVAGNLSSPSSTTVTPTGSDPNVITFTFSVTGNQTAFKQVLTNLERSIRSIDITSLQIASQTATNQIMTVQGQSFYQPAVQVQLTNETVR
jgi:hypothetical protein